MVDLPKTIEELYLWAERKDYGYYFQIKGIHGFYCTDTKYLKKAKISELLRMRKELVNDSQPTSFPTVPGSYCFIVKASAFDTTFDRFAYTKDFLSPWDCQTPTTKSTTGWEKTPTDASKKLFLRVGRTRHWKFNFRRMVAFFTELRNPVKDGNVFFQYIVYRDKDQMNESCIDSRSSTPTDPTQLMITSPSSSSEASSENVSSRSPQKFLSPQKSTPVKRPHISIGSKRFSPCAKKTCSSPAKEASCEKPTDDEVAELIKEKDRLFREIEESEKGAEQDDEEFLEKSEKMREEEEYSPGLPRLGFPRTTVGLVQLHEGLVMENVKRAMDKMKKFGKRYEDDPDRQLEFVQKAKELKDLQAYLNSEVQITKENMVLALNEGREEFVRICPDAEDPVPVETTKSIGENP